MWSGEGEHKEVGMMRGEGVGRRRGRQKEG